MAAEAPELVECVQLMGATLREHLARQTTWDAAKQEAEAGRADWRELRESAKSDLLQSAFLAALRVAARQYLVSTGDLDAFDAHGGDLQFPLRFTWRDASTQSAQLVEVEATMSSGDPRTQVIVFAAAQAAEAAYSAALERFGPGRVTGLRALRNRQRDRRVLEELLASHASDADAFEAAGVSTAAGERIKRRLGLTKRTGRG